MCDASLLWIFVLPWPEELLEAERKRETLDVGGQDRKILRDTQNDPKIPRGYLSRKAEEVNDT